MADVLLRAWILKGPESCDADRARRAVWGGSGGRDRAFDAEGGREGRARAEGGAVFGALGAGAKPKLSKLSKFDDRAVSRKTQTSTNKLFGKHINHMIINFEVEFVDTLPVDARIVTISAAWLSLRDPELGTTCLLRCSRVTRPCGCPGLIILRIALVGRDNYPDVVCWYSRDVNV